MDRIYIRVIGGLMLAVIAFGVRFCMVSERRGDANKQVLAEAREMIKEVPGYEKDPNYMEWLVTEGHGEVFDAAYKSDYGSRRRAGTDKMDFDQYERDLFRWMIARARQDNRVTAAEALEKYRDNPEGVQEEAAPKEPENPFRKK